MVRVGDGSSALSSGATAVFLDEYTPSGTLVQSIALPTSAVGANRRLTVSGTATSEGALALSADGRYLSLAGFDADPGTAAVAGTPTAATNRVVARVDGNGRRRLVDGDLRRHHRVRRQGCGHRRRQPLLGRRIERRRAPGPAGQRRRDHADQQRRADEPARGRASRRSVARVDGQRSAGVYAVGSGLPTTGGQTPALVAPSPSPYGFVALDRDPGVPGVDTLYVADDSGPSGGIVKFSFDGTTWTARGSFRPSGSGVRGLTGAVTPSGVTLYATTSATANQLVTVNDSAAFDAPIAATSTTLASTAAANTVFRGVAFAPSGGGGGENVAPTIGTQPQDATIGTGDDGDPHGGGGRDRSAELPVVHGRRRRHEHPGRSPARRRSPRPR